MLSEARNRGMYYTSDDRHPTYTGTTSVYDSSVLSA